MATINKNYLSQGGLRLGGPVPGIRAPQIQGANAAANQVARATAGLYLRPGQVRLPLFEAPEVQNVGFDPEGVARTLTVFHQKALKLADEKEEYAAREQLVKVRNRLREIGYNPEDGYFLTSGRETLDRRPEVQQRVEEVIHQGLMGISPGARAKLFPAVQAERNQFLDNIGRYSASQFKQWEQDVQTSEIHDLQDRIKETISDGTRTDLMVQQELTRIFPDYDNGQVNPENAIKRKQLYDEIATQIVAQLPYTPMGIAGAIERYDYYQDKVGADTQAKMTRQLQSDINSYNARVDREDAHNRRIKTEMEQDLAGKLVGRFLDGDPANDPTPEELASLSTKGRLPYNIAMTLNNQFLEGSGAESDMGTVYRYSQNLLDLAAVGFPRDDVDWIMNQVFADPHVRPEEKRTLWTLQKTLARSDQKEEYRRGIETLKSWISPNGFAKSFYNYEIENLQMVALRELNEHLRSGMSIPEALTLMEPRYHGVNKDAVNALPPFWDGSRPVDIAGLMDVQEKLLRAMEEGRLSPSIERNSFKLLEDYQAHLGSGYQNPFQRSYNPEDENETETFLPEPEEPLPTGIPDEEEEQGVIDWIQSWMSP